MGDKSDFQKTVIITREWILTHSKTIEQRYMQRNVKIFL